MAITVTCPSGLKGEIRKPKVRDINELRKGGNSIQAYTKLLRTCWERTLEKGVYAWEGDPNNVPWSEVLSGDRFYLLLQIRVALFGPIYKFHVSCGSCGSRFAWEVNVLEDIEVKPLTDEAKEILRGQDKLFSCTTLDNREVTFRAGTGRMEAAIDDQEEPLIKFVLPRIHTLDGQAQPKQIREALLDMDQDVFDALQADMAVSECGPDTSILARCHCKATSMVDLPFDRTFFYPRSGS